MRLKRDEPHRLFLVGAVAFALFDDLDRRWPQLQILILKISERLSNTFDVVARWCPTARAQVLTLSLAVTVVGIAYATTVAGGSDSYGYVSQADLWLGGDLRIDQPWVEEAPWPSARSSFAPLAYRARTDDFTIVPTYAPGLAILMAGAKGLAGQEAMFWVVPLLGGVLVLSTYGVARRVAPPGAAVVAAWLIATCPVMIYMVVMPMSDVAAAALWMAACCVLLRPGVPAAGVAGIAAAMAILVRPNLAFVAAILAVWPLWQAVRSIEGRGAAFSRCVVFGVGTSTGVFAVAAINQHLYGSPIVSGYGDVNPLFAWSHLWPNLVKYSTWLIESQTIAAAAGLVALVLPWRRLWPDVEHRRFLVISTGVVGSVWLSYCLYLEFDAWWYLRFMLPAIPFIAIGTATVAVGIWRAGGFTTRVVVALGLILVVLAQCRFAVDSGAFGFWRSERRYVSVGRLVRAQTAENSVVVSNQHSGSIRYYGGRTTLRFENLGRGSLDEAIAWLSSRGVSSYLVLEEWEIPLFRDRFAGQAALARLETPRTICRGPATVMLFDLVGPVSRDPIEMIDRAEGLRSARPVPLDTIVLQPASKGGTTRSGP